MSTAVPPEATQLRHQLASAATRLTLARRTHLEALLRRAETQADGVRQRLLRRCADVLQQALAAPAPPSLPSQARATGAGHRQLRQLSRDLSRQRAPLDKRASGIDLDDYLRQQEARILASLPDELQPSAAADGESAAGLQAARRLRQIRTTRAAELLVEESLRQRPENPGPLNPHMLALRALTSMGDLSADYLHRFVGYVDSLLWLEQAEQKLAAAGKSAKSGNSAKGRKRR